MWAGSFECLAEAHAALGHPKIAETERHLAAALVALKEEPRNQQLQQDVRNGLAAYVLNSDLQVSYAFL